jgi:hypothetical protein
LALLKKIDFNKKKILYSKYFFVTEYFWCSIYRYGNVTKEHLYLLALGVATAGRQLVALVPLVAFQRFEAAGPWLDLLQIMENKNVFSKGNSGGLILYIY